MMDTEQDVIVVGAGVSGLSLAYFLAQMDRKVLVLERKEKVGGAIEQLSYEDFSIDVGAHTGYNSYVAFSDLAKDSGAILSLQKREKQRYFFYTENGLKKLTKPLNFATLLLNIPKIFTSTREGKSVEEYFSNILGKGNYERFAQHFFKAVLSQKAAGFPAAFFLKKRKYKDNNLPKSFTFPKGMQTFIDSLAQHPNIEILKGVIVEKIEKRGEMFEVSFAQGVWETKDIAFASYANEVSELAQYIAPEVSEQLAKLHYQTVSSLGIIVNKNVMSGLREFAGLLTTTNDFTSVVSRDIAPHERFRGFTIHAQGKVEEELLLRRLCATLKINTSDILVKKYKNSELPKLKKGHEEFLETLLETIQETPNFYITGNYFQGLSLEDCVRRSKEEALRYINTL